jgi:glucose dehydrogenase
MYLSASFDRVFAIDAETGKELWNYSYQNLRELDQKTGRERVRSTGESGIRRRTSIATLVREPISTQIVFWLWMPIQVS